MPRLDAAPRRALWRRTPRAAAMLALLLALFLAGAAGAQPSAAPSLAAKPWPWLDDDAARDTLEQRFTAPEGFARVSVDAGSFGAFVRGLPMLPDGAPVLAFDGRTLSTPHAGVVDLDVGTVDLQQCADSAIRLRAEYLWAKSAHAQIAFHTTSGDRVPFARYAAGEQLVVRGNKVGWSKSSASGRGLDNRAAFRRYLHDVFMYAGSLSLARDTEPVKGEPTPGDLFVVGGSPGHVLVVLDVAARGDERRFLVGEGFMPAQSFHVVPSVDGASWIAPAPDGSIAVPTWPSPFPRSALRRFKQP